MADLVTDKHHRDLLADDTRCPLLVSMLWTCPGDFWHNIAATVISTRYTPGWDNAFPKVVSIWLANGNIDLSSSEQSRLAVIHEFLSRCGSPSLMMKLDVGTRNQADIYEAAAKIQADSGWRLVLKQMQGPTKGFDELWKVTSVAHSPLQTERALDKPVMNTAKSRWPPLHHFVATTILMQYLSFGIPEADRRARLRFLSCKLREGASSDPSIKRQVLQKVSELEELIKRARLSSGRSDDAKIVLFHDRRAPDNSGLDSLPQHLAQVRAEARARDMIVVPIASGRDSLRSTYDQLDLYDARHQRDFFQSRFFVTEFWRLVSQMGNVFGFIGGRSASIDIAVFMGLNCFEWDEPILWDSNMRGSGQRSSTYLRFQAPQHLRLLNTSSIISVGLLDKESWDPVLRKYTRLEERPLRQWLDGDRLMHPDLPGNEDGEKLIRWCLQTYLEQPDIGVVACNIRELYRRAFGRQFQATRAKA